MEKPSVLDRLNNWAKGSVTLKIIVVGILILLIPSSMMNSLIREREEIRDEATNEVSAKWGGSQTVGGPILSTPYKARLKVENGKEETVIRYAHFLPDQLHIKGNIVPEKRYRGIYVVVLYNIQFCVSGTFSDPNLEKLNVAPSDFLLEDAFVSLGISDMKGIMFKVMHWHGGQLYLLVGILVTLPLLFVAVGLKRKQEHLLTYYNWMLVRISILGTIAVIMYILPLK